MICIVCQTHSTAADFRVPMLPASLGTRSDLLPPGMVCEPCQDYFVREVDGPFIARAGPEVQRAPTRDDAAVRVPPGPLVSRLIAKLALEEIGRRLTADQGRIAHLGGETLLDLIRHPPSRPGHVAPAERQ